MLEWNLHHADHIKFYERLKSRGEPTPLDEWEEFANVTTVWYNKVYKILARSRNHSGNVPLSEIIVFANEFDLIGSKLEFVNVISAMDSHFVDYMNRKQKNGK